jgi:hypothetical protein
VSVQDVVERDVISARTVARLEDARPIDWNVGDIGGRLPEYTPLIALIVLLAFTAEGFLANRFYKGQPEAEKVEEQGGGGGG